MKQSWKKWLRNATFGVMAVAALGVIAGCGSDNAAPADKSVVKFGVTNFANTVTHNYPTEVILCWLQCICEVCHSNF